TPAHLDERPGAVQDLKVNGGVTYGALVDVRLTSHVGAEASWIWRESGVRLAAGSTSTTLFFIDVSQAGGAVVYAFGDEKRDLRPFVLGGLGASTLSSHGLDSITKLTWTVGAGAKWWLLVNRIGARVDARFAPIRLNSSSSAYCVPLDFCQSALSPLT